MEAALISLSNQMELMSLGTYFPNLAEICASDVAKQRASSIEASVNFRGLNQEGQADFLAKRASCRTLQANPCVPYKLSP